MRIVVCVVGMISVSSVFSVGWVVLSNTLHWPAGTAVALSVVSGAIIGSIAAGLAR